MDSNLFYLLTFLGASTTILLVVCLFLFLKNRKLSSINVKLRCKKDQVKDYFIEFEKEYDFSPDEMGRALDSMYYQLGDSLQQHIDLFTKPHFLHPQVEKELYVIGTCLRLMHHNRIHLPEYQKYVVPDIFSIEKSKSNFFSGIKVDDITLDLLEKIRGFHATQLAKLSFWMLAHNATADKVINYEHLCLNYCRIPQF